MYLCSLTYVGALAIWDVRKKLIPAIVFYLGGAFSLLYALFVVLTEGRDICEVGLSLLPGIIYLLLAYVTRQQIGYGDGILFLILGLLLGKEAVLFVLVVGQLIASVWGIFLIAFRKAGKGTTMAYIPFVFIAMLLYRMVAL